MKQNRCAGFILIAVVYVMAALLAVFIYRAAESQTLISRIFMAEKRLLVRKAAYKDYISRTPMLLPGWRRKSGIPLFSDMH